MCSALCYRGIIMGRGSYFLQPEEQVDTSVFRFCLYDEFSDSFHFFLKRARFRHGFLMSIGHSFPLFLLRMVVQFLVLESQFLILSRYLLYHVAPIVLANDVLYPALPRVILAEKANIGGLKKKDF